MNMHRNKGMQIDHLEILKANIVKFSYQISIQCPMLELDNSHLQLKVWQAFHLVVPKVKNSHYLGQELDLETKE